MVEEGKNKNNNNPVHPNVQCWKDHAVGPSSLWNNFHNSCRNSNIALDDKNINISGRRSGVSSDINITSRSSDIATDGSIISELVSKRGSQRRKGDLVRDPVVTLNSEGEWDLPTTDVTGVWEYTTEAFMLSGIQNNINDGSSRNIVATDDSIRTIEQTVPIEGYDLRTTIKSVVSEPTNKELVIGT